MQQLAEQITAAGAGDRYYPITTRARLAEPQFWIEQAKARDNNIRCWLIPKAVISISTAAPI